MDSFSGSFPSRPDPSRLPAQPASGSDLVRASDVEREHVVKLLTEACAEGRLTLEELGGRVSSAYSAVTRADLVPLTVDLPVVGMEAELAGSFTGNLGAGNLGADMVVADDKRTKRKRKWLVCVMSEHNSQGHWRLGGRVAAVTLMGESTIDLRQAIIETPSIEMTLYLLMGSQTVIVPAGVEVEVTGFVFMGERRVNVADTRPRPGVPRLHIRVIGTMGEVKIETG